jgi:hypothetical protein
VDCESVESTDSAFGVVPHEPVAVLELGIAAVVVDQIVRGFVAV